LIETTIARMSPGRLEAALQVAGFLPVVSSRPPHLFLGPDTAPSSIDEPTTLF
jgi:hypothetical protein